MFLGEDLPEPGDAGDVLLAGLRVWMADRVADEVLVEEHAPDALVGLGGTLDGVNRVLGDVDPGTLDGDALMGAVLALEGVQRRLDSLKAVTLGALDAAGVCEAKVGLSAKTWKANRTHNAVGGVGRELKIARTLARFEGFAVALGEGLVSVDHVSGLAQVCNDRTIEGLMAVEDDLVRFAKMHRYRVFIAYLRQVVAMLDGDGAEPDCGDRDTAAMGTDLEGHLHVNLELTGHNAIEIEAIINSETDRQYRVAVREHDTAGVAMPSMGVLRCRAVVELLRRGANPNTSGGKRHTSVVLAVGVDRDGCRSGVHSTNGTPVDAVAAATLMCDAVFHPVFVDPANNPLNMGRSVRLFTPAQKHALTLRDGGCVFPGCDQPPERCEGHHKHPWAQGGRTDVGCGAMLCPRHHGLAHRERPWTLLTCHIDDLPADLQAAHRARAQSARLEPAEHVQVFRDPNGRLWLAQNATDHHGPSGPAAPPGPNQRRPAA